MRPAGSSVPELVADGVQLSWRLSLAFIVGGTPATTRNPSCGSGTDGF